MTCIPTWPHARHFGVNPWGDDRWLVEMPRTCVQNRHHRNQAADGGLWHFAACFLLCCEPNKDKAATLAVPRSGLKWIEWLHCIPKDTVSYLLCIIQWLDACAATLPQMMFENCGFVATFPWDSTSGCVSNLTPLPLLFEERSLSDYPKTHGAPRRHWQQRSHHDPAPQPAPAVVKHRVEGAHTIRLDRFSL